MECILINNNIILKSKQLALYTSIYVSKFLWVENLEGEEETEAREAMSESIEGIEYLLKVLKLDFNKAAFEESLASHNRDSLTDEITWFFKNDIFSKQLNLKYGKYAELVYMITILTAFNKGIVSSLAMDVSYEFLSDDTEEEHRWIEMLNESKNSFSAYLNFINLNKYNIQNFIPELSPMLYDINLIDINNEEITNENSDTHLEYFESVDEILNRGLNALSPYYFIQLDRLERGKTLINNLLECKPGKGKKNWQDYEEICIKILNFLFVPPFSEVKEQSRTESGDTRRDGVLPNNKFTGFWEVIRHEFQSKHIICEFKNYAADVGKDQLNQLRIYLSRPTVGRFGMLFLRKKPSKKLLEARKRAYEESNILILLLDDETVVEMIKMAIYADSAEEVLENLKIQFELTY